MSLFNRNSFRELILLPDSISFLSLLSINTFKPMMQKANFHENIGRGSENLEGGVVVWALLSHVSNLEKL